MALEFVDKIEGFIPSIKGPSKPLSLREKMYWTAGIIAIYFLLYNTYAVGVNQTAISAQPFFQLMSIVFASKIGSLITVGIGPIVLASIVLQLIVGSDLIKIDLNNPLEKARFQTLQKLLAIIIAIVESIIYISTSFVPISTPSAFWLVAIQLAIGAILIIFLDEMMTKYGITSGINMFIASGVAYAIIAGTLTILLPGV